MNVNQSKIVLLSGDEDMSDIQLFSTAMGAVIGYSVVYLYSKICKDKEIEPLCIGGILGVISSAGTYLFFKWL